MGDPEPLIVLCGAALLILATFFSTLRRRRRARRDYWLPDGSRVRRPKALDRGEKGKEAFKCRLASKLFLKDRCALPDQMSFVFTFSWGRFILAMRDRHRADKNEISVFGFGVATKNLPHDVLLYGFTPIQRLSW
jgi:hypothetical protein